MSGKPKVYIATPCYDMMRIETCVSLLDTFSALGGSGIECKFKSVKTSLVTHGRNLLTCGFLDSGFDYMLFVDADVEFKPEAVMRMLVPKKEEWIEDYYIQIAAYAMAHDAYYGSSIEQGVIMVCTPDLYYQEFKCSGAELKKWKHAFLKRLDHYHELIFDEKERAKVDPDKLLEEFEEDGH